MRNPREWLDSPDPERLPPLMFWGAAVGTVLGFVVGIWAAIDCGNNCYPIFGDILAVGLFTGIGAFAGYSVSAMAGIGVAAVADIVRRLKGPPPP